MKKGFTLTELLLALTIIGVIAMLAVPVLISNVNKKAFATQVKNTVDIIEQVAQDELYTRGIRDLNNTDFSDPDKLLSDSHFHISKKCSAADSVKECWKTGSTGSDKVTYKTLSGSTNTSVAAATTIILKNGVMIKYNTESNGGKTIGRFCIDVNGNDKPNIFGRDYFSFYITPKGNVVGVEGAGRTYNSTLCKGNDTITTVYCYSALVNNGWKIKD